MHYSAYSNTNTMFGHNTVIILLFCLGFSLAQEWTAYVPTDETSSLCDPSRTGNYSIISMATDKQERLWQFTGYGSCDYPYAFLRYFDRTNGSWTVVWREGDSTGPSYRFGNSLWVDKRNHIYVYGGMNTTGEGEVMYDFWKYSVDSNTWTNLTIGDSPNSVQRGVEDPTNYPGRRTNSGSWCTPDDDSLWLFSGVQDVRASTGMDLWRYNLTSERWAYVAGSLEPGDNVINATDPLDVTPRPRAGSLCAVDGENNLWLFGGYANDLWVFKRSSGWQYKSNKISNTFICLLSNFSSFPAGQFSSELYPDCASFSSMTYAGNNIMALWTTYYNEYVNETRLKLWLYNMTSEEWAYYDHYSIVPVADVLYQPDQSTSPGYTSLTSANSPHSLWIVAAQSRGVYVMDFPQCFDLLSPCSEHASCSSDVLKMTCTCNEGYEGDGISCVPAPPKASASGASILYMASSFTFALIYSFY